MNPKNRYRLLVLGYLIINSLLVIPDFFSYGLLAPFHLLIFILMLKRISKHESFTKQNAWAAFVPGAGVMGIFLLLIWVGSEGQSNILKTIIDAPIPFIIVFVLCVVEGIILLRY